MLQQTTVVAAAPCWERFLARFPDVRALAAADEADVLCAWSGLGYYRRARDLHAAARLIVAKANGRLPRTRNAWQELPGVGPYTAGAIASIALGEIVPAVDANARRVLVRLLCAAPEEASALRGRALEAVAAALVDPHRPGDWNQALMDLATAVCRPGAPACSICPLSGQCRARAAGIAAVVPPAAARRAPVAVRLSLLVLEMAGAILLVPPGTAPLASLPVASRSVRDDFKPLYRGLFGLPATPWYAARDAEIGRDDGFARLAARAWRDWAGLARGAAGSVGEAGTVKHAITTFRLDVAVTRLQWLDKEAPAVCPAGSVWRRPDGPFPPLSSLATKALRCAGVT